MLYGGVQPDVFDQLDWDEAADLVERVEKIQFERDKLLMTFLAKLFEHHAYITGSGLGLKMPVPREAGDMATDDRGEMPWTGMDRGEIPWHGPKRG